MAFLAATACLWGSILHQMQPVRLLRDWNYLHPFAYLHPSAAAVDDVDAKAVST